jgi:putative oxidoreductase
MFMRFFEKYAYALMRIVAGFLFLWHGSQKLFNLPAAGFDFPAWLKFSAGPIEFFCGLLIMIGLGTRWAAFIASGEMAVAYWYGHGTNALLPLINKGEMAALYCFIFLFISAAGPGIWSIDGLLGNRK